MNTAYKIIVQGRVQGVGYRWFTMQMAQKFNVKGYVANLINGDVEVFVQGDEAAVHEFISHLRKGPTFSQVTNLIINNVDFDQSLNQFKVKH